MKKVMYRACIFDLDGTLTDTLESLTYSVNETMKEIGLPGITSGQCREFVGNGAKVLIEKTLKASGDEELARFDEAFAAYRRIFDKCCTYRVKPYPGIPEMLREMKERGLRLGVLSNKPDRQAVHVVEEIFGKGVFDHIQGQKDGVPRKPDPTAVLSIAGEFGASPSETLYIGDSEEPHRQKRSISEIRKWTALQEKLPEWIRYWCPGDFVPVTCWRRQSRSA